MNVTAASETIRRRHWLLLCVACLLLWGVWGFLSKMLADAIGAVEAQILFTLGMLPPALFAIRTLHRRALVASSRGVAYALLNGLLTGVGSLCFFKALERGPASLISPLIAVYPLVTVGLAIALLRERITALQALGALCAVGGLVLLS